MANGPRTEQYLADLAAVEAAVRNNLAAPASDSPAFLDDCLARLRDIPLDVEPARRAALLIDIAWQYHHHGQKIFSAVEPVAMAVMIARQIDAPPLLRRALTIQGLVLTATSNRTDAMRAFMEALDIAERIQDPLAVAAVWINAAITCFDSSRFGEARECNERGVAILYGLEETALTRSFAARGLHGSALCSLHLREYASGIATSEEAVALLAEPRNREEEAARALAEATFTQLLLATDRIEQAAQHAAIAQAMAEKSCSVRAQIAAATVAGLVDVYKGNTDVGLTRMVKVREQGRILPGSLSQTLQASVLAYERAGRPDRALSMNRELLMNMRKALREAIVQNQDLHLRRLELADSDSQALGPLQTTDEELQRKLADVASRQVEFLQEIALTVELREEESGLHCYRVGMWARELALAAGLSDREARDIELAARLHDIGKVVIPDSIIRKKGALSMGERELIETHAASGAEFLSRAKIPYARLAAEIALRHHESWDSGGYPEGLRGTDIPRAARIVAVADAFDALTHNRPFRSAYRVEEALRHLNDERGKQFDPELVDLFVPLVRRTYAEPADVEAYARDLAARAPLVAMQRALGDKLARAAPANDQQRQQPQSRLAPWRSPDRKG